MSLRIALGISLLVISGLCGAETRTEQSSPDGGSPEDVKGFDYYEREACAQRRTIKSLHVLADSWSYEKTVAMRCYPTGETVGREGVTVELSGQTTQADTSLLKRVRDQLRLTRSEFEALREVSLTQEAEQFVRFYFGDSYSSVSLCIKGCETKELTDQRGRRFAAIRDTYIDTYIAMKSIQDPIVDHQLGARWKSFETTPGCLYFLSGDDAVIKSRLPSGQSGEALRRDWCKGDAPLPNETNAKGARVPKPALVTDFDYEDVSGCRPPHAKETLVTDGASWRYWKQISMICYPKAEDVTQLYRDIVITIDADVEGQDAKLISETRSQMKRNMVALDALGSIYFSDCGGPNIGIVVDGHRKSFGCVHDWRGWYGEDGKPFEDKAHRTRFVKLQPVAKAFKVIRDRSSRRINEELRGRWLSVAGAESCSYVVTGDDAVMLSKLPPGKSAEKHRQLSSCASLAFTPDGE